MLLQPPSSPALSRRRILGGGAAALVLPALFARPLRAAPAQDVADAAALKQALAAAGPGTVLRLAPGDYGTLDFRRTAGSAAAPVTIAAADPARPPRFSGLKIIEMAHLVLDGLTFAYRPVAEDGLRQRPFVVSGSADITLRNAAFTGAPIRGLSAIDDGHGAGVALTVRDGRQVHIENCTVQGFYMGLYAVRSRDVAILGCDIAGMRMDALKLAQLVGLRVEGNYIHDFDRAEGSPDHCDMIQLFSAGTDQPSTDIVIRGNILSSGRGPWTQSIWMRNEAVDKQGGGRAMFYRNVRIEENLIVNAHTHGIAVGETDGLVIRRNSVLRNARSQGDRDNPRLYLPAIRVAQDSTNVVIEANVTGGVRVEAGLPGWRVANNVVVQDRTRLEPGYYGDVLEGDLTDAATLRFRKGGPLDGAEVGASRMQAS